MPVQRSPTSITTRSAAQRHRSNSGHDGTPSSDEGADATMLPTPAPEDRIPVQPSVHFTDQRRGQASIIRDAIARFGANDILASDGSNLRVWLRELREIAFSFLDNSEFYDRNNSHDQLERVARSILLGSVDRSIRFELYDFHTSFAMISQLRSRFRTISRSAQLNRWTNLHRITCNPDANISEISSTLRNAYADFIDSGINLTRDNVLGLLLQSSIPHGTDLRNEFDHRVDGVLSLNRDRPLSFDKLIEILSACQTRVTARAEERQHPNLPSVYSANLNPPAREASVESHPDNVYALAGRPMMNRGPRPRTCFRCGSTNHQIAQCTTPEANLQARTPAKPSVPQNQSNQFQAHYPIITPPVGYPTGPYYRPTQPPQQQLCPADSYRPEYGNKPGPKPSARQAETDGPPEGMNFEPQFSNLEFKEQTDEPANRETLLDTGATNHLTGDSERYDDFLWSQFNSNRP
ncbi:hypothetical protein PGTUg99_050239 [Puccinia graminis f. sp. tritici]|uniref:CCHC-type domain-containing protein n=1 Tax=Puccinia graminis f. sp. tritici TaxID=56615 RepID=A0A5B0NNF9_PUCGR|nr:hypothetical protein PGTUg99_050239 [Puccinia graminis f. sp. tritici]